MMLATVGKVDWGGKEQWWCFSVCGVSQSVALLCI